MSRKHPGSRHYAALNRRRWQWVRLKVFERDKWRCRRCGRAGKLEADHVTPLHRGGDPYDQDNLQALCRPCHVAKTAGENAKPDPERDRWRELVKDIAASS